MATEPEQDTNTDNLRPYEEPEFIVVPKPQFKKDDEQKDPYVAPFFNFGKATLITTNLYNKYIMPNFSLENGMFIIDNKIYSSNDYDILLYFTPSLNKTISAICPIYGANKPTDGVGVYRPYIRTPFPNKPDGKAGNN